MPEIKSNGKIPVILVITVAVLAVLVVLFVQQSCSTSKDLALIKGKLDTELTPIKKDIADSKTRDEALLKGVKNLNQALYGDEKTPGVMQKLDKSLVQSAALQEKLSQRPKPVDPEDIQDLKQCQTEYEELYVSYNICLDANKAKESSLVLFGKVKENLIEQLSLLNGAVTELKSQVKNYEEIEKKVTESMDKLDRVYRVNRFWTNVKNIGIGTVTGAVAAMILKAVLK